MFDLFILPDLQTYARSDDAYTNKNIFQEDRNKDKDNKDEKW